MYPIIYSFEKHSIFKTEFICWGLKGINTPIFQKILTP